MAFAGQVANFLLHHQAHQRQSGFSQQMADAILQHADDVGHRQDHLDVGVLFGGEPAKLLHRSLLVDLVSFLHSDSPFFLAENYPKAITPSGVRVATFYALTGILPADRTPVTGPGVAGDCAAAGGAARRAETHRHAAARRRAHCQSPAVADGLTFVRSDSAPQSGRLQAAP